MVRSDITVMKYILAICLWGITFLDASHIDVTPQEQAWLQKHKTIRVRVAKEMLPYQMFKDGQASGISVEYIKYFANTFNINIEYVTKGSWTEVLEHIKTRNGVDVLLKATTSQDRSSAMLFSKPYIAFPFSLLSNNTIPADTFFESPTRTIALAKDYVINEKLQRDYPKFHYQIYETNLEAMRAVDVHKADGYIGDIAIASLFVKNYGFKNVHISRFGQYASEEQSVVTGKDWPEFISLFNKVLDSMPEDLHVKIKRKYVPFLQEEPSLDTKLEFSEEEKAYLAKNQRIIVSNEREWYPYDFNENGEARGYSIDYIRLLAQRIGLHVEFVSDTWPRLLEQFKEKKIDILQPIIPTDERRNLFLFSDKFITMELVLIAQSKRVDIKSLKDLSGKTLGAGKGWASTDYLKEQYKDIKIIEYDTTKEMLEAIAFGLIDAGIDDRFTANYSISKEMLSNLHIVTQVELEKLGDKNLYIGFQKENRVLQSLFNKALKSVSKDELNTLNAKWQSEMRQKHDTLSFTIDEQLYLSRKKAIKMCVDPDWMPLEMIEKGQHIGMAADYMKLMEKSIGIPFILVETKTWLESLDFAKERKCDIFSLVMATPQRKLTMDFTKPYISIPLVLVSKLDKVFYSDIGAITDKPIGIAKGYAYGEILRVRYPNVKLVEVESETDGLQKVQEGKLFASIGTLATVAYQIQKEYFGSLKIVGKFDEKWELGVATRNDEPLLFDIFEKAINAIDKSESQTILNRWVAISYDQHTDYSIVYKILGIFGVLFLIVMYRQYQLKKYNDQLEILSNTDKLTGIYNRLKLDDILEYEKKVFDRFGRPLSIIMFDLDNFKSVNDNYGHKIGDDILKIITKIVLTCKRETDAFGRWGGEEFLVICHETDIDGATALAEKFREAIEQYEFPHIISLTVSFGVAQFEQYETIVKVFDKADRALYEAKSQGRNRVVAKRY